MKKSDCVPIVGDGAIATASTGEGRLIPVLILDCNNHKEIQNMLSLHQDLNNPGDVISTWAVNWLNSREIFLFLNFTKPIEHELILKFDLQKQYFLADGIVQSKALYLQSNASGYNISASLNEPKILIEVPSTLNKWDKILIKQIIKSLRSNGLKKGQNIKQVASNILDETREFWRWCYSA